MATLVQIVGTGGAASFEIGADRPGKPSRLVAIADLRLAETHITRQEWRQVRNNATGYTLALGGQTGGGAGTINHPAIQVSWFDCAAWCNAASEADGLDPRYTTPGNAVFKGGATGAVGLSAGTGYRLVTSAEWEYAARSSTRPGNEYAGAFGGTTRAQACNLRDDYLYLPGGPGEPDGTWDASTGAPTVIRVGQRTSNPFGLFDMSGNAQEWTQTPWSGTTDDETQDSHPLRATQRIIRGGSAYGSDDRLLPNQRTVLERSQRLPTVGLRIALDGLA